MYFIDYVKKPLLQNNWRLQFLYEISAEWKLAE